MNPISRSSFLVAAAIAAYAGGVRAETPFGVTSLAEAKAMYEHDVEACKAGKVDEDLKTCLTEARRAYEDARREVLRNQRGRSQQGKEEPAQKP